MKTNLNKLFKTDESLEKEGVWFDVTKETSFLLRRFGGSNSQKLQAAMAKFHKPYSRLIENNSLSEREQVEIFAKVFISTCLVDWKGVEIEGSVVPCTPENALKLFVSLPELFDVLFSYAKGVDSFKEDLGNS